MFNSERVYRQQVWDISQNSIGEDGAAMDKGRTYLLMWHYSIQLYTTNIWLFFWF
jgi:hypothetical protein